MGRQDESKGIGQGIRAYGLVGTDDRIGYELAESGITPNKN